MSDVEKIWNYIYERWGEESEEIDAAVATMFEIASATNCEDEAGETVSTMLILLREGLGIDDTEELREILTTAGLNKTLIQQLLD